MTAVSWEQQAATYFDNEIKDPIRQQLIGRQLFAKQTILGPDKYRVNFNKLTELGSAQSGRGIPSVGSGRDRVTLTATEIDMIMFWKEYEISKADWTNWQNMGTNLGTANAISAAQVVGVAEDAYLINGWKPDGTNYIENGIYQSAGNTEATADDFGTFGKATEKISLGWGKLDEDLITGCNYNLLLHPTQYQQARASRSSYGIREWPDLIDLLNPYPNQPKGTIIKCPAGITVDTGVMCPVDPSGVYMDLVIGANYVNDVYQNGPSAKFSPIGGITVSSIIARFTRTNAICTFTGI